MIEEWRDIKGYEGLYQVSNKGNVRHVKFNRLLKPSKSGQYSIAILSKGGKKVGKSVHRLVAEAFIPNPNNLPVINHIDQDKHNNTVENLEWCTQSYNIRYSRKPKKQKKIINLLTGEEYDSVMDVHKKTGHTIQTIYRILKREVPPLAYK